MSEKMTKSQEVELYISGLQNPIQTEVAVQAPQTLAVAMRMAQIYELKYQESRQQFGPPTRPQQPLNSMVMDKPSFPPLRLTHIEMAEHCTNGLCFNSDELFTPNYSCKRLFCLDAIGEEEIEGDGGQELLDEPAICLHVITGVANSRTM